MNTNRFLRRRASSFSIAAAGTLISPGVCLAASALGGPVAGAVAAYVVLIVVLRKALRHWRTDWDELGPDLPRPTPTERGGHFLSAKASGRLSSVRGHNTGAREHSVRWLLVAAAVAGSAPASSQAQQTLFNVPSADVLDRKKVYVEEDTLWRPSDPGFAAFTVRGVYGFGSHVEGGVNVGGFVTPGRSTPTAAIALKWQPVNVGGFALTCGAQGLFFVRGSKDGDPAGQFYAHASYAFPTNTRVTAGGWVATTGFAAPDDARGGLFALEQKVNDHLTIAADWFSGRNGLGYLSPGIISAWGLWTIYAAYSFKNGDSKGNAALIELGLTF